MPKMRIDRFFSMQEIISRSEIKAVLKNGAVKINDKVIKMPDEQVDTDLDTVFYYGNEVLFKPYIYVMLNKPLSVVSATTDKTHKTVLDLVPHELFRSDMFPAGRLDKDSTGFVLLTNDGDFAHRILSPKNHVEKTYVVTLDGQLTQQGIDILENGVTLCDGEICKPAKITILNNTNNENYENNTADLQQHECMSTAEIILSEGKYHQIKRMFGVIDLGVNSLKRTKIGNLPLDPDLPLGMCREIVHKELNEILAK